MGNLGEKRAERLALGSKVRSPTLGAPHLLPRPLRSGAHRRHGAAKGHDRSKNRRCKRWGCNRGRPTLQSLNQGLHLPSGLGEEFNLGRQGSWGSEPRGHEFYQVRQGDSTKGPEGKKERASTRGPGDGYKRDLK